MKPTAGSSRNRSKNGTTPGWVTSQRRCSRWSPFSIPAARARAKPASIGRSQSSRTSQPGAAPSTRLSNTVVMPEPAHCTSCAIAADTASQTTPMRGL